MRALLHDLVYVLCVFRAVGEIVLLIAERPTTSQNTAVL